MYRGDLGALRVYGEGEWPEKRVQYLQCKWGFFFYFRTGKN